jgi:hypothetical protein
MNSNTEATIAVSFLSSASATCAGCIRVQQVCRSFYELAVESKGVGE